MFRIKNGLLEKHKKYGAAESNVCAVNTGAYF
jgi:hypothetical protein